MSALPPKADKERRDWHVRFVPKADSCIATKNNLLDNLVGACEERRRYREAERLRRNQVYDEIELSRLLDRQLRWFRPAQDFIGIVAGAPEEIRIVCAVGHEAARRHHAPNTVHRR